MRFYWVFFAFLNLIKPPEIIPSALLIGFFSDINYARLNNHTPRLLAAVRFSTKKAISEKIKDELTKILAIFFKQKYSLFVNFNKKIITLARYIRLNFGVLSMFD